MASILDSFRETFSEKFGFFKILVFAAPIYYFHTQYLKGATAFADVLIYVYITAFFLLGFFIKVTHSVLNEEDFIMPVLNPLKLAFSAIKSIIAVLPATLITVAAANFIMPYINIVDWVDTIFKVIIWLVVASIILTSFLMYIKEEKIIDAFNIKTLSDKAGDFILGIIFYIIQIIIINIPTYGFIGYAIYMLFGFGPILYFFIAYGIVFNVVASAHYMAQLQYEILGYDKQNFTPPPNAY